MINGKKYNVPLNSLSSVVKKIFWSIKNSGEILHKLKSRGFLASGLSTYDFPTLYATLNYIDKL